MVLVTAARFIALEIKVLFIHNRQLHASPYQGPVATTHFVNIIQHQCSSDSDRMAKAEAISSVQNILETLPAVQLPPLPTSVELCTCCAPGVRSSLVQSMPGCGHVCYYQLSLLVNMQHTVPCCWSGETLSREFKLLAPHTWTSLLRLPTRMAIFMTTATCLLETRLRLHSHFI